MTRRASLLRALRALRRRGGFARRLVERGWLVVAALVMLLGMMKGPTRSFYCPITQLTFAAPPCGGNGGDTTSWMTPWVVDDALAGPTVRSADCCEERWRAGVPAAALPDAVAREVAAPSLLATLPALPRGIEIASSSLPFEAAPRARAGPPPKDARERRAELMVFLE